MILSYSVARTPSPSGNILPLSDALRIPEEWAGERSVGLASLRGVETGGVGTPADTGEQGCHRDSQRGLPARNIFPLPRLIFPVPSATANAKGSHELSETSLQM